VRLTERERRTLAGIERQLARDDPGFAAAMREGLPPGWTSLRWTGPARDAAAVVAGLSALLCLVLLLIGPAVVAGAVAAAAAGPRWYRQVGRAAANHHDRVE
jgi:Flp pilus assembly protein TadB